MPTTQLGSHPAYYDDHGAGHPVLLLNGLGASRLGWWKQIAPFAEKFRVLNLDNRDAGDSARAVMPYTVADLAEDAARLIRDLDLHRTHVVGISMGGMIAQELAICYPELVDRLVLVSTTAGGPEATQAAPEVQALLLRGGDEDIETRVRATYNAIAGPGYMQAHPEDMEQIVDFALALPISLDGYMRQLGACVAHLVDGTADRLSHLKAPTLVVHGDSDPLIPYPNGQYLAAHIPGARLSTYAGVGHLPPIEMPGRFNREIIEFLS